MIRTPFLDRRSAPRQPALAREVQGRVELMGGSELDDALADIEHWSHLWLIFWFHLSDGWRPKVTPPRSARKRGLFATRAPYRPNPVGLSAVALERVDGRVLHVRGVDMVDNTPLIDIKPYVPYTDALDASTGWLDAAVDPGPRFAVRWDARALEQLHWLQSLHGIELRGPAQQVLSSGPAPHAYRRIKPDGDRLRLALQDWRLWFTVEGETVTVEQIGSGYRTRVLADLDARPKAATPLSVHRAFVERFGR